MKKSLLIIVTVLLVHTAAAQAQQSPPTQDPGTPASDAFPPGYAPPPGFAPPPANPPPAPAQPGYPPPAYGPPPTYGQPYGAQPYGPSYSPPGRYPPPSYYYYTPPPPPPRLVTDRPFTLGGGMGWGGLIFNDPGLRRSESTDGMSYTFRLGFGLRPGLLLLWDVEGALVKRGTLTTAQTANFAALQLFVTRRLFLKGGFGLAQIVQNDRPSHWGAAGMLGLGYEIIQGWNWSLDLETTISGARYNTNGRDENWFNWSLVNVAINFF